MTHSVGVFERRDTTLLFHKYTVMNHLKTREHSKLIRLAMLNQLQLYCHQEVQQLSQIPLQTIKSYQIAITFLTVCNIYMNAEFIVHCFKLPKYGD
ncbi:hypothetical protein T07_4964 [Trichinella nelsoni]|uniref:Uncharacterized protein n=1 Tax=Trichinella nelsoni TaxID=6336 RepID=A0A0V0SK96_9BILA|nr:hypothetical protein T07_4964 [Trichinella nelsoni]